MAQAPSTGSVSLGLMLGELIDTALTVEPAGGMTAPWQRWLDELGVAPLPEETRYAAARQTRLARGAPLGEVLSCIRALLERSAVAQENPACAAEGRALSELLSAAEARYLELARARPRGMFGYALANAASSASPLWGSGTYVLKCPDCGGPRLRPGDLNCEFCGGKTTR